MIGGIAKSLIIIYEYILLSTCQNTSKVRAYSAITAFASPRYVLQFLVSPQAKTCFHLGRATEFQTLSRSVTTFILIPMVITYHGLQFFKIQQGDTVIAFNPVSKSADAKTTRFGADIALLTLNHPDFNGVENLSYGDKKPFVVSGGGEYETKEIFIRGFGLWTDYGGERKVNTVYYLIVDGIKILFLGATKALTMTEDMEEKIDGVDVLFVPVGGGDVCSPGEAHKLALFFEPKMIIPMQYSPQSLKTFLHEAGEEGADASEKLVLKQKDMEEKKGVEVAVLKAV